LAATASNIGSMDIYIFILLISSLLFLSMIRHNKDLRKSAMILVIALVCLMHRLDKRGKI